MAVERAVRIPGPDGALLDADLALPERARGVVVFAHGSGSGRHSPRNRQVARELGRRGLATLLLDLLTPEEERLDRRTAQLRFDVELLADRLELATSWLDGRRETRSLRVGYFGASTGAAAALLAASRRTGRVAAVVSRGGRPDLAGGALRRVWSPTLLIVGGRDDLVWHLNRKALVEIPTEAALEVIPGATHLFEEPGALEEVARLAGDWLLRHLGDPSRSPPSRRSGGAPDR